MGGGVGPGAGAGPLLRFRTLRTSHVVRVRPVLGVPRPILGPLAGQLQVRGPTQPAWG
jgi:hypothetical protein